MKTNKINLPYRPSTKDNQVYRNIMQEIANENKEKKKRDREIMFETGFPCVCGGIVIGMIIADLLLR